MGGRPGRSHLNLVGFGVVLLLANLIGVQLALVVRLRRLPLGDRLASLVAPAVMPAM